MPYKAKTDQAAYYKRNREWLDLYNYEWNALQRLRTICFLGGKCKGCGEDDPDVLDFDHINNDGRLETGKRLHFSVKQSPDRFQLLCKNCNWRKELKRRQDAIKARVISQSGKREHQDRDSSRKTAETSRCHCA